MKEGIRRELYPGVHLITERGLREPARGGREVLVPLPDLLVLEAHASDQGGPKVFQAGDGDTDWDMIDPQGQAAAIIVEGQRAITEMEAWTPTPAKLSRLKVKDVDTLREEVALALGKIEQVPSVEGADVNALLHDAHLALLHIKQLLEGK